MKTITCPNCFAVFDMREGSPAVISTAVAPVAPAAAGTVIGVVEELSTQPSAPVVSQPVVAPVIASIPSGLLGSKTNPFKINKPAGGDNVYIPENTSPDRSGRGSITIPANSKLYFEIDPVELTGRPVSVFAMRMVFFEGGGGVCKFTQDKKTGAYSPEDCRGYTGLNDIVFDGQPDKIADKKYLYAIQGSPDGDTHDAIWAVIPPGTTM